MQLIELLVRFALGAAVGTAALFVAALTMSPQGLRNWRVALVELFADKKAARRANNPMPRFVSVRWKPYYRPAAAPADLQLFTLVVVTGLLSEAGLVANLKGQHPANVYRGSSIVLASPRFDLMKPTIGRTLLIAQSR